MIDLIDRQEAIKALCKAGCDSGHCGVSCPDVMAIEDLPSADVQPVRHGRWVNRPDIYLDEQTWECSECGEPWTFIVGTPLDNNANYCPNCGARMDGE